MNINTYNNIKQGLLFIILGIIFLIASIVLFDLIEVGGVQLILPSLGIIFFIIGLFRIFDQTNQNEEI